ncbi:MAG: hydrogenase maturation protease [Gemmatimonadaceae bacterium]|jgi:hydrogenase maturation protease|nr:hydrogenase maturation protease [Gemmatimonadaceae bacterium]
MAATAVLGFGNPVRNDDGIGPYVIAALRRRLPDGLDVALLDMGSAAFETLYQLRGHDRFICVDAVVNSGEPAGTLFQVPAHVIERAPQDDPMVFLHGLKWTQALTYARRILGPAYPSDITAYLIAVDDLGFDMTLTPAVRDAGDRLVTRLLDRLCPTSDSLVPICA